ncbi:MAG: alpha amylase [Lachnospiraceae bacterium]|nr:alpha amylase [Lachnospiraceae bacterium]
MKRLNKLILTALMTVTFVTAILLTACGKSGALDISEGAGESSGEQTAESEKDELTAGDYTDPLLSSGKKKEDKEKVQIPADYEYALDDMGFLDIGEIYEPVDDNYRNYYEIFVLSFYDSDGDGAGDINGVTKKLDYIKEMGFNGIWLMPVMSSPSYHKYDTTDYYSIDPLYGTNEDFENLLKEAHARGINVIIDLVINHSSSEHPWFKAACEYLRNLPEKEAPVESDCPYYGYYNFSRELKSGYCKVEGTDSWYYEGVFNYTQPDLNFENPDLVKEIDDVAKLWTKMGVDGFRVDAAAHFKEGNREFNEEVLSHIYETCKEINPDFYMVSEVWLDEVTIANYYESLTPSFFNFDAGDSSGRLIKTAGGTGKMSSYANALVRYQEEFGSRNPDYIDAPFITNHDQARVAGALKNDPDDMKKACGLLMSMQGAPFVYYGEEIGMKSSGSSDENKRIAFYWSDEDMTGMTKGPEGAETIKSNFEALDKQAADPDSIVNYYRRALNFRNRYPEIARGEVFAREEDLTDDTAVIKKEYEGSVIYMAFNSSDEERQIDLENGAKIAEGNALILGGYLTIHPWESIKTENGMLILPPGAIAVLRQQ